MADQRFCLRWNNHQPNLVNVMTGLLNSEMFVDATIAAEGRKIQVHKVVLSACSSYFQMLFNETPCQHPIIIIKDMSYNHLKTLIEFMYYGEVNISQDQLPIILKAAESLQIKGLTEKTMFPFATTRHAETEYSLLSPSAKRKKMHLMKTSSDKSEHNSSIEDISVTEQDNMSTRSQPTSQGQETSKPISSVSKQSSTDNHTTIVHHKPEVNKRIRTLVRQPHIKINDNDMSTDTSMVINETNDESEPVIRVLERQCSEPNPSSTNTLAVPKPTIVKQISQPSELSPTARGFFNDELPTSASQVNTNDSYNGSTRSDHCPLLRSGPALGCSFCWNTIDTRGRFLRRKTKYHCPECNINLCLVPCFQEFHEKQIQTKSTDVPTTDHPRTQKVTDDTAV
ncbi:broad-complex core protein isoforms 1/2/3/4/5 isoform X1 [Acyrthosiphon pisum]|uniref:BTB domain-containing protein n=2 Tax=Acyrthosiphon pisum TaxID=7029 RepID=A0A8R2NR49_ACYPI|nr:broad-complex core protein isoforms 1/2/3/4/5 isoform X1 [Acyrthosiphon pisum]XP_029344521.1 broad-complex core protein isoforms 1/2/3/4/5 isoform X1 [Acyrthosiphon pisum]|eukprot:XP_001946000.2 PREDICTED: broad-complex core protein isoforms 1/2/3/4/5-like [Acyrthosiphon pisum]